MCNKSVINAFICGKSAESSNRNLRSYGNKLISYYTTIAERLEDGTIVVNRTKYSVSTSKIQTWLSASLMINGIKNIEVFNVPLGASDLAKYVN